MKTLIIKIIKKIFSPIINTSKNRPVLNFINLSKVYYNLNLITRKNRLRVNSIMILIFRKLELIPNSITSVTFMFIKKIFKINAVMSIIYIKTILNTIISIIKLIIGTTITIMNFIVISIIIFLVKLVNLKYILSALMFLLPYIINSLTMIINGHGVFIDMGTCEVWDYSLEFISDDNTLNENIIQTIYADDNNADNHTHDVDNDYNNNKIEELLNKIDCHYYDYHQELVEEGLEYYFLKKIVDELSNVIKIPMFENTILTMEEVTKNNRRKALLNIIHYLLEKAKIFGINFEEILKSKDNLTEKDWADIKRKIMRFNDHNNNDKRIFEVLRKMYIFIPPSLDFSNKVLKIVRIPEEIVKSHGKFRSYIKNLNFNDINIKRDLDYFLVNCKMMELRAALFQLKYDYETSKVTLKEYLYKYASLMLEFEKMLSKNKWYGEWMKKFKFTRTFGERRRKPKP